VAHAIAHLLYIRKKLNDYEWDRIIYAMKQRGLKLTEREEEIIKEILHRLNLLLSKS